MENQQINLSDEVIIEIVHSIKDIVIELINKAFSQGQCRIDCRREDDQYVEQK
ncbi:MAG: hypothetical protein LUH14_10575 [Clostridiaceae bacterium]|nr:hypothetical protein [Clostridiaceae bacterium]